MPPDDLYGMKHADGTKKENFEHHSGTEFLDGGTVRALQWNDLWKQWQPVTPYGEDTKRQFTPYLPGDEETWQGAVQVLRQDVKVLTQDEVRTLQAQLRNFPDIRSLTALLVARVPLSTSLPTETGAFTARELLLLKQFAYYGKELSEKWAPTLSRMWPAQVWDELLLPFGHISEPTFSVQHAASSSYHNSARQLAGIQSRLSQSLKAWRESWRQDAGIVPDKNNLIRCQLPQHRTEADYLKHHKDAQWVQETPFESVFKVQASQAMRTLQDQLHQIRVEMDEEADKVLIHLSTSLRRLGVLWQQAIQQIAELDLRVSKVALYLAWDTASVPVAGGHPSVEGAVHPVLAGRLQDVGRFYVPLDWGVPKGASVVSGSNMGGKTVAMSLLTVCQLCAQYGLPVPARHFETRLFRWVRFYAGADKGDRADTDVAGSSGLSSFGVEVVQVKAAWDCLMTGEPALICFDEPAKSTNPIEGEALVVGLLRSLQKVLSKLNPASTVIVATHFPQAAAEPGFTQFRVRGLRQAGLSHLAGGSDVQTLKRLQYLADAMDYRLERVETAQWSEEGLQVAAWIGLPDEILTESRRYREGHRES